MRLYGEDPRAAQAARQVLAYVLDQSLRLLHPYMPFVTETIWQNLPGLAEEADALIVARWPKHAGRIDDEAEAKFARIQEIVRGIRNARSEYDVEPARRIVALFSAGEQVDLLDQNLALLATLARLDENRLEIAETLPAPDSAASLAAGGVTVYLPLAGMVDLAAERKRIEKELANVDKQLARIDGLLGNTASPTKPRPMSLSGSRTRRSSWRG